MLAFSPLIYMNPETEVNNAPKELTIKSNIVSTRPDFCIFNPNKLSIENSKISHTVPMATAKQNENTDIRSGLAFTLWCV